MNISPISNISNVQMITKAKYEASNENSFESTLNKSIENKNSEELKEACKQFESYFLHGVFKEMRKTVHSENGVMPKSNAENIFQEMLDVKICENASETGGIGLADKMYEQISKEL